MHSMIHYPYPIVLLDPYPILVPASIPRVFLRRRVHCILSLTLDSVNYQSSIEDVSFVLDLSITLKLTIELNEFQRYLARRLYYTTLRMLRGVGFLTPADVTR